jgi:hypothetical protein
MITTERRIAVMDITTMWRIDAVLFFVASAGFLAWGLIRQAGPSVVAFVVMAVVALLFERWMPQPPSAAALAQAHEPPPDAAVHRTAARYGARGAFVMAALCAFQAVLALVTLPPGFFAGWMAAFCVSRLRALAVARRIERESGVRLSVRLQRNVWRRHVPAYYAEKRGLSPAVTSSGSWAARG